MINVAVRHYVKLYIATQTRPSGQLLGRSFSAFRPLLGCPSGSPEKLKFWKPGRRGLGGWPKGLCVFTGDSANVIRELIIAKQSTW